MSEDKTTSKVEAPSEAKSAPATAPTVAPVVIKTKKPKSGAGFKIATLFLLLLALGASGTSLALSVFLYNKDEQPITFNYGSNGNSASFVEGSVADVASRVSPGVVSIITETRKSNWLGSTTQTSAGTGMIVTADGYILTCKHVVDGARSISVILDDGTTFENVELVGSDPLNDVAFLKIKDGKDLPTVKLGDSKTIIPGQQVIAIGNALGQFQNTITQGIISGVGRSIVAYGENLADAESLTDIIQTDAAINSGNSGGPLVNAAGEVIGINTATSSDADGISFAIPISSVKGMLKNIINNNSAKRAYAGITYINITPDIAIEYKLPVSSGAYLFTNSNNSAISKDSAAEKAGLKDEDIITKVNGVEIGRIGSLSTLLGEFAPGDTIQLTVLRDSKERVVNLTLDEYPD